MLFVFFCVEGVIGYIESWFWGVESAEGLAGRKGGGWRLEGVLLFILL
jgi:hypothetical protein